MTLIRPFKAVRATRDKVALVTTRSFELYSNKELASILKYNPFSFLHILKPGYKYQLNVKGEQRFELIRNRYLEFKENNYFIQDKNPVYYLHQKTTHNSKYWGFIATSSVSDYENGTIKKHETTLKDREALFGKYLEVTGFNAEPVLLTYPDNPKLSAIYAKYEKQRPEYEFTSNKKRTHHFWVIDNKEDIAIITSEFAKMDAVYIADGHHRTASSSYLANLKKAANPRHNGTEDYNFFMSYLIAESNLNITSFNRYVKNINGLSKESFLIKLDTFFRIQKQDKQYKPTKKHHFNMYLDGCYYALYLRKTSYKITNALDDLDSQILFSTILKPILGINDLSNSNKIVYKPAMLSDSQLKDEVDTGKYAVGFGMFPINVTQLKAIADAGLTMPPKSTYIEPKLRSGLTIFEF